MKKLLRGYISAFSKIAAKLTRSSGFSKNRFSGRGKADTVMPSEAASIEKNKPSVQGTLRKSAGTKSTSSGKSTVCFLMVPVIGMVKPGQAEIKNRSSLTGLIKTNLKLNLHTAVEVFSHTKALCIIGIGKISKLIKSIKSAVYGKVLAGYAKIFILNEGSVVKFCGNAYPRSGTGFMASRKNTYITMGSLEKGSPLPVKMFKKTKTAVSATVDNLYYVGDLLLTKTAAKVYGRLFFENSASGILKGKAKIRATGALSIVDVSDWQYPVQNGSNLSITQVYSATQYGTHLVIN